MMNVNFVLPEHLFDSLNPREDGDQDNYKKVYLASEVDARIAELEKALFEAKRGHYACEDPWYQCPMHPEGTANEFKPNECDCGADEFNAKIDAVLNSVL